MKIKTTQHFSIMFVMRECPSRIHNLRQLCAVWCVCFCYLFSVLRFTLTLWARTKKKIMDNKKLFSSDRWDIQRDDVGSLSCVNVDNFVSHLQNYKTVYMRLCLPIYKCDMLFHLFSHLLLMCSLSAGSSIFHQRQKHRFMSNRFAFLFGAECFLSLSLSLLARIKPNALTTTNKLKKKSHNKLNIMW